MNRTPVFHSEVGFRNSVFTELIRDFRLLLKIAKEVVGDQEMFCRVCLHACTFPTDKMSLQMLWDEFQKLPIAHRAEILLSLRKEQPKRYF